MQSRLAVPYADTRAEHLRFSLTAGPQKPLARCDHRLGDTTISLHLLGASHQVVVEDGRGRLCETVACLPELDTPLPDAFADGCYALTTSVQECDADGLSTVVADITRRIDAHRRVGLPAIMGHFPGLPMAVTAIIVDPLDDTLGWETWHTYPQSGEVVRTSSVLRRRPGTIR